MTNETMTDEPAIDMDKYVASESIRKVTEAYPMFDAAIMPTGLKEVPDIASGGQRSRKYGMVLSIAFVPALDQQPQPLTIPKNQLPTLFIDADNLEDLKERCNQEVENMLKMAEDFMSGELKPEQGGPAPTE
jgi:hypothetical protein